jgi:hypothetical protein
MAASLLASDVAVQISSSERGTMAPVRNDLAMIIYGTSRLSSYLDPSQHCLQERVHLGE